MIARIHHTLAGRRAALSLGACLAALALSVSACGGSDSGESATETPAAEAPAAKAPAPTPAKPAAPAPKANVTEAGKMPSGYDLPTYPDAEPAGSMAVPGGGSLSAFRAAAGTGDVFDYYVAELPRQGWTIDAQNDAQTEIKASKGDRKVVVRLVSREGKTDIAVVEGG